MQAPQHPSAIIIIIIITRLNDCSSIMEASIVRLLVSLAVFAVATVTSRTVLIQTNAPWPRYTSSDIAELSEVLADLDPSLKLFWKYVDGMCERSAKIDPLLRSSTSADAEIAELKATAMEVASSILHQESMQSYVSTSLNLGAFSAAVQFYVSLEPPSSSSSSRSSCKEDNIALVSYDTNIPQAGGRLACTAEESLKGMGVEVEIGDEDRSQAIKTSSSSSSFSSWEHEYQASGSSSASTMITLYGSIGSTSFCAAHNTLLSRAQVGEIRYKIRHYFKNLPEIDTVTQLRGFGVVLDIKNMEYKNVDDRENKSEEGENTDESEDASDTKKIQFPEGEQVNGIIFSTLHKRKPQLQDELQLLRNTFLDDSAKLVGDKSEMKVWRMKDLGLQTLQSIINAPNVLDRMTELVQSFPLHAPSLSSLKVLPSVKDDIAQMYESGVLRYLPSNSLFINGNRISIDDNTFNIFDVLITIKDEYAQMNTLDSMGLPKILRNKLKNLALDAADSNSESDGMRGLSDITRVDASKGGKSVILFLNNLERDKAYKRWPKTVRQLLYPSWSLHTIAKNLYTIILVVDPLTSGGASLLMQTHMLMEQNYPVRFGVIFDCSKHNDASRRDSKKATPYDVCLLVSRIKEKYSTATLLQFLFTLANTVSGEQEDMFGMFGGGMSDTVVEHEPLSRSEVIELYAGVISEGDDMNSRGSVQTFVDDATSLLESHPNVYERGQEYARNCTEYLDGKGFPVNSFSLNGILSTSGQQMAQSLMQLVGREQYILSMMVQSGELTDKVKSIYSLLMEKSGGGYSRYHPLLNQKEAVYSDFTSDASNHLLSKELHWFASESSHSTPDESGLFEVHNSTIVFVTPTDLGVRTAQESLKWLQDNGNQDGGNMRVAIALNIPSDLQGCLGSTSTQSCPNIDSNLVKYTYGLLDALDGAKTSSDLIEYFEKLLKEGYDTSKTPSDSQVSKALSIHRKLTDIFKCNELKTIISYNTRLIELDQAKDDKYFHAEDYKLLSGVEKKIANMLLEVLTSNDRKSKYSSNDFLRMISFVGNYGMGGNNRFPVDKILEKMEVGSGNAFIKEIAPKKVATMNENGEVVEDEDEEDFMMTGSGDILIHVVVDPLSLAGQRAASLMKMIRDQLRLPQIVIFTPQYEMSGDFPLQNFYRYVYAPLGKESSAVFRSLPTQHTLTTRLDTPESWNVQSVSGVQDPDNLRCSESGCGDQAGSDVTRLGYSLKSLLLVGQCYEPSTSGYGGSPPNGLQLTLTRNNRTTDTLVMQNLGYFQLQASPGIWKLKLAEGRATELYIITDSEPDGGILYPVRTFADDMKRLLVVKRPGMEKFSLLDKDSDDKTDASSSSLWGSVFSQKSTSGVKKDEEDDGKIHVFSLATGHMYERLLRIMMLSVSKRTSKPVKFWLFENYLSPTFKDIAAVMAEEYNFEVDYVTYKWPEWLNQQTEKQRIIWGYKILFLDVLFPLNVKKVIYVDADQVLRADLNELWEMDLKGKPYAYTPFCSSREETLGFQFWRSGYWANLLGGKPYHISALYVVDLENFRRNAVGDNLRAVYSNLAKDPNSLANLDQDLPNYAQSMGIPIHSLPQEWLWCETWCSEKSKKKAKTIDLCNSPLHKEPKLDMARRVISGSLFNESWVELDEEVTKISDRVMNMMSSNRN